MDPLSLLRDYTIRDELASVQRVGDEYRFGDDYRFPCSKETAYRSKQGALYTLDSLVFFVKNTHIKHTEYLLQAHALKLQVVTFTDRKPLLDYLEGRVSTSDAVELLPPSALTSSAAGGGGGGTAAAAAADETPLKRQKYDEQDKAAEGPLLIGLVRSLERPVRDRETILLCPNKSFEGILSILTRRDEEKKKNEGGQQQQHHQQQQQQQQQQQRKDVADKDRFVKVEASEVGVADHGGHHKDFPARRPPPPPPSSSSMVQQQHQQLPKSNPRTSKIEGPPIILVPNASQTLLNTYNAKEFLEDGVYVVPDAKAKSMPKKPESLIIHRRIGRDIPVKYEIRDKPTALSSKDWERVVAVFVLGKEWQFKDWPFKDHVDIFNKILGVYLRFEDDSMESVKVVMQWNVKIFSLSKHKRHQDRTAVLEFWDKLDAFVRARRLPIVF